jgi:hypothetical protein
VLVRILVCGGRNYDERDMVWRTLDQYQENYGPLTVIQGGAPGADHWAREWAHQQTPAQEVTLVSVRPIGKNGAPRPAATRRS